jgi:predicted CXXCH cytochrome family protein
MKPFKLVLLFVFAFALAGVAYGQGTGDGFKNLVRGTKHDMTTPHGYPTPTPNFVGATALCEFCHAPHKYNAIGTEPPLLWNIQIATGQYQTYSSSSFDGKATIRNPTAASPTNSAAYYTLLCLSCHDGTVTETGLYHRTSTIGSNTTGTLSGRSLTAVSGLMNDHPVDFTYSASLATTDGGLQIPNEGAAVNVARVGAGNLPLFKDQPGDTSGRLECATCHNPHNPTNGKFLRMANDGSALCLNCHGA